MNTNIKLRSVNKSFSKFGGLFTYNKLFDCTMLGPKLANILPKNKIATRTTPVDKFKALVLGFVAGADSLDDMEKLSLDKGFYSVNGKVDAANTYGQFLRKFKNKCLKFINWGCSGCYLVFW